MKPMPILSAEPAVYPENLFSESADNRIGRWWAVYTRSRAEKSLARHLAGRSVAYYLPLKRQSWRNNGRNFTSLLPLFPGYVFLHGTDDDRVAALESNVISRILDVPNQRRLWSDLRQVDRMLTSEVEVGQSDELALGDPVRIVAGPFEGLHGVLLRRGNQLRLVIEVAFLKQTVSVEVDAWMVEPADRSVLAGIGD